MLAAGARPFTTVGREKRAKSSQGNEKGLAATFIVRAHLVCCLIQTDRGPCALRAWAPAPSGTIVPLARPASKSGRSHLVNPHFLEITMS